MYGVPQAEGMSTETPPADDPTKEKTPEDFLSLSGWDPNLALTADRSVRYNLDYAGNRTSVNDSQTGFSAYSPNHVNEYNQVGNDAVTNGTNHELTSYQTNSYTYKDERLTNVSSGTNGYDLAYDALGRCVKRVVNGVIKYYIYDGDRPILEYGVLGNLRGKNLYGKGVDEILMRYDPTITPSPSPAPDLRTFYYQQDHEGSVRYLTDGSGNRIEEYRYDVFGTPTIYDVANPSHVRTSSIVSNRFMFTGREYSALFGFYECRARAYHPRLGRFMSEDPKLFVRGIPLGKTPDDWSFAARPDEAEFNLFRYCGNDPIDFTDPMGLDFLSSASDFAAGTGDFISFGATAYIRESLPGTYGPGGGVDKGSAAYKMGEGTGLVLGMATGEGEVAAARGGIRAAEQAAARSFSPRTLAHFERQLQTGGEKALRSSLKNITKNMKEELANIEKYKAAGGRTSVPEREVRQYEKDIQAIRHILNRLEQSKPPSPPVLPPTEPH